MSEKFELSLGEYLKTIQRGEVVLVEYTSDEPIHLILHMILRYLKRENIPVVILDVLDHLHMFRNHLKFAGVPTDLIDEARVIKIGGIISDRNVLGKIDLTEDPAVMRTKYHKTLEQLANEHEYFVRVGLGMDKLLRMAKSPWDLEVLLGTVSRPMIGHEKSWGIIFVNTRVISEECVQELREIASRVFDIKLEKGEITFTVVKSVNFDEYGAAISIKAQELQDYLGK